ncbi:MAG: DUF2007 domain-containing protein [Melioribacteraceae bacterium]|nr:DUF2007 domain-containing protein [Melioribacteraceae bacterium]
MICPKCEYEYIEGITECPDCHVALVTAEEFEGNLVHNSDWVVIYTTFDQVEAEMIKSNLEGGDIETTILSQKDSSLHLITDSGNIKLLVKKKDADDALMIIKDINSTTDDEE